jgi:hypothetical protein
VQEGSTTTLRGGEGDDQDDTSLYGGLSAIADDRDGYEGSCERTWDRGGS